MSNNIFLNNNLDEQLLNKIFFTLINEDKWDTLFEILENILFVIRNCFIIIITFIKNLELFNNQFNLARVCIDFHCCLDN